MIKIFCDRCGKECVGKKSSARIQICGGLDLDIVVCTECNDKIKEFINKNEKSMHVETICDICGKEIKSQELIYKKAYVAGSHHVRIDEDLIVEDCCEDCMKKVKKKKTYKRIGEKK